jgi:hypothetical protein
MNLRGLKTKKKTFAALGKQIAAARNASSPISAFRLHSFHSQNNSHVSNFLLIILAGICSLN